MADIASEPWTGFSPERWTAFRSESPAGFIGIRNDHLGVGRMCAHRMMDRLAVAGPVRQDRGNRAGHLVVSRRGPMTLHQQGVIHANLLYSKGIRWPGRGQTDADGGAEPMPIHNLPSWPVF